MLKVLWWYGRACSLMLLVMMTMTPVSTALLTNDITMLLYGVSAVLIGPALPGMIVISFGLPGAYLAWIANTRLAGKE